MQRSTSWGKADKLCFMHSLTLCVSDRMFVCVGRVMARHECHRLSLKHPSGDFPLKLNGGILYVWHLKNTKERTKTSRINIQNNIHKNNNKKSKKYMLLFFSLGHSLKHIFAPFKEKRHCNPLQTFQNLSEHAFEQQN